MFCSKNLNFTREHALTAWVSYQQQFVGVSNERSETG